MKLGRRTMVAVGSVLLAGSAALAAVFPARSPAQKLRADVAVQVAGYTRCLITALLACERTGAHSGAECSLQSATAVAPADARGRFAPAVARCDAKLNYNRRGPRGNTSVQNYELIGCPTGTSGPRLADMDELEEIARLAKAEIDAVAGLLPFISGCSDTKKCIAAAKVIASHAAAFGKCQTSCENDYKGRRGNGGTDDDLERCGPSGAPPAVVCIDKARAKFDDKTETWPFAAAVRDTVEDTIDEQTDALFNAPPNC